MVNVLRVRSTPCLLTALRLSHSIRNVACVAFITRLADGAHVFDSWLLFIPVPRGLGKEKSLGRPLRRSQPEGRKG